MPHGYVALLGAFGFISLAFMYLVARANALAKDLQWNDTMSKWGFYLVTLGVILFSIPTLAIGLHPTETSFCLGYDTARLRETLEDVMGRMWLLIIPDSMMILGGTIIFFDVLFFLGCKFLKKPFKKLLRYLEALSEF